MTVTGRRRCAFLVAVTGLAVSLLVSAAPTALASAAPASGSGSATVRFRVVDALTESLSVSSKKTGYGHFRNDPDGAAYLGIDDFTVSSDWWTPLDAEATVTYRIGNTAYYLWVWASNPDIGSNVADCKIVDSRGTTVRTSPYQCAKQSHTGRDFDADFVVEPKDAATQRVTSASRYTQRYVLEALCGPQGTTFSSCDVASRADIENVSTSSGPQTVVSSLLVNCSSRDSTKTLSFSHTEGETSTVGVKGEANGALYRKLNGKLEVSYQRSWQESSTVSESASVTVAPGEYGWLSNAINMQNVRGTFTLKAGNQTFVVPDVTVSAPVTAQPLTSTITHTEKLADRDKVCAGHTAEFELATTVAPRSDGTYSIGLSSMNHRVITVPGGTRSSVQLQLGAAGEGRAQQWTFEEIAGKPGFFQLRGENDPDQCLDLSGDDQRTVLQYRCNGGANQQWRLAFDPTGNSYAIVSAYRGAVIAAEGTAVGSPIVGTGTATAGDAATQWRFTRVAR